MGATEIGPPRRGYRTQPRFNPGFNPEFTELEGTADNWKTSLGATEHRLEAYATLVFRTIGRSLIERRLVSATTFTRSDNLEMSKGREGT
jgi:hypothetical protein